MGIAYKYKRKHVWGSVPSLIATCYAMLVWYHSNSEWIWGGVSLGREERWWVGLGGVGGVSLQLGCNLWEKKN